MKKLILKKVPKTETNYSTQGIKIKALSSAATVKKGLEKGCLTLTNTI